MQRQEMRASAFPLYGTYWCVQQRLLAEPKERAHSSSPFPSTAQLFIWQALRELTQDTDHLDTLLLKELGTYRTPTHGPESDKKWREGLGAVVKQLRTTNLGKDANAIAARIAEYRREFVGDPTMTLNLS